MARGRHNLSHQHKLSCNMGELVPIGCLEVLPGDTFIHRTSLMARVAPLVNPIMHNVAIRVHHWFVPNRITWPEFENWIVGESEDDMPTVDIAAGRDILDHFGLPEAVGQAVSALPARAYNNIWNEYYRDQDLDEKRLEDDLTLARIRWEKDYFTTARDDPALGDAIDVPFAPGTDVFLKSKTELVDSNRQVRVDGQNEQINLIDDQPGEHYFYSDLSEAEGGGIDINDLRRALALQSFAEVRAKFGSRYVDYLRYLGVRPSDSRLGRPEFLGGGSQDINFSEVLAMAEGQTTQVGDMYGHGIAGLRARRYRKQFNEHGWVLSLLSARPKTVYMDGINRKFTRFDPMDFWQQELEVLPWQEVKMPEVHHEGDAETVFGYVPRYDDYRHELSYVSGSFRDGPELDWHMGRKFETPPTLNASFVECTPTDRIYGDTEMPELLMNVQHQITAARLVRTNAKMGSVNL